MAWYSACPPKLGRLGSQGDRMSPQHSGVSLVASYRGDLMDIPAYVSAPRQNETVVASYCKRKCLPLFDFNKLLKQLSVASFFEMQANRLKAKLHMTEINLLVRNANFALNHRCKFLYVSNRYMVVTCHKLISSIDLKSRVKKVQNILATYLQHLYL